LRDAQLLIAAVSTLGPRQHSTRTVGVPLLKVKPESAKASHQVPRLVVASHTDGLAESRTRGGSAVDLLLLAPTSLVRGQHEVVAGQAIACAWLQPRVRCICCGISLC